MVAPHNSSRASTYAGIDSPRLGEVEDRDSVQPLISNLEVSDIFSLTLCLDTSTLVGGHNAPFY
jgi:hypothetical protein